MGPDLGNAVRGFKKALRGDDGTEDAKSTDAKEKLQADPPAAASSVHQEQHDSAETK
jgi:sec-independent protein translocase protein TatA